MPQIPIMAWPPRMNVSGTGWEMVEQDSTEEVAQCVGFLFSCQPGQLMDEPTMGLVDPTFEQNGVTPAELEQVVHRWEPRALLQFERDEIIGLAQSVDIVVESDVL